MSYKIKNAIVKKDYQGNLTLIDPEGIFKNSDSFIAIDSDDLITIQLLINGIIRNDFEGWREIESFKKTDSIKELFTKLGYSKEDLVEMLKEF